MTEEGRDRTNEFYGPLVVEGIGIVGRLTSTEIRTMLRRLEEIRALTDRHRDRLRT